MKSARFPILVPILLLSLLLSITPLVLTGLGVSGRMSFLSWMPLTQIEPLLDAFSAHYPDVEIDFQNVPAGPEFTQRLQILASAGELPDLFHIPSPITLMAQAGHLADLSHLESVQALPQGYTSYYTYDGSVYAYAPDAWIGGIFYDKALFAANGLAVPEIYADLLEAAAVFHEQGIKPIRFGSGNLVDMVFMLHGAEILLDDPGFNSGIDSGETTFAEGYLDALNTWKTDWVDTGYVSQDMAAIEDPQRMDEFAVGEAAMTISGPCAVGGILEANPELDLGVFPFVGSTAEDVFTLGAVNVGLAIDSNAENPAAAEAFISFVGSEEGLGVLQSVTGNFLGVEGIEYEVHPVNQVMSPIAAKGNFSFPPVYWTYFGTLHPIFVKGTQEILLGILTPEELVAELDAKQAELMDSGG